ncbi:MAG: hypothetical protein Kow0049_09420 [Stanieria sp.]
MNEIDDLKKELKQTQLAYQMAAQMSQFKAGFLARTSHELRSPLSSLIGLHQLILSDLCDSPEEQKEFISQAYQSALKLMKLIDEIVSVAKTEYGTNKLHLESLQLAEVLSVVYNLTHLQAANRNLQLEIKPCESSCYILADRARLIQAIVNLIDSGISLMNQGKITVFNNCDPQVNEIKIEIKFDCYAQLWQQNDQSNPAINNLSIDEIKRLIQEINLSPGMRLLLSQTLVETMDGRLEFIDFSPEVTQINLIFQKSTISS